MTNSVDSVGFWKRIGNWLRGVGSLHGTAGGAGGGGMRLARCIGSVMTAGISDRLLGVIGENAIALMSQLAGVVMGGAVAFRSSSLMQSCITVVQIFAHPSAFCMW
jgi:hypothetical protein